MTMRAMLACLAVWALAAPAQAEAIKVGGGTSAGGNLYLAQDRGYFAAEGLEVEFIPFPAAEPVAVALVAGSIDFGATGISAALYNFAGQGLVKIIAGSLREALNCLDADRTFLTRGGVFTDDQIDAYMELKWEEVYNWEHQPAPVEYKMYYSI